MTHHANSLPGLDKAHAYTFAAHAIKQEDISHNAANVLRKIKQSGFEGFLVGGSVRDLILGQTPKDFDIATNATPEQLRRIFKNSRIIGKRFRIVHILCGREIIEVTTFRGNHNAQDKLHALQSDDGILLRDNVYGSIEEDALRRDFTVNALYYDIHTDKVYDFCQGFDDIKKRVLRLIGDPVQRYTEDPVRMLRALRLSCKLSFHLHPQSNAAIDECAHLLAKIPPARLYDESTKLFGHGYAEKTFHTLANYNLLRFLLFKSDLLSSPAYTTFVRQALRNSDKRVQTGKSITPTFLFAVFLWPSFRELLNKEPYISQNIQDACLAASALIFQKQTQIAEINRFVQAGIRDIWLLQFRLEQQHEQPKKALKTLSQPRFRAAYDFLLLREDSEESPDKLAPWWTDFIAQNPVSAAEPLAREDKKMRPVRKRRPSTH